VPEERQESLVPEFGDANTGIERFRFEKVSGKIEWILFFFDPERKKGSNEGEYFWDLQRMWLRHGYSQYGRLGGSNKIQARALSLR
jgi:hypothetical protein